MRFLLLITLLLPLWAHGFESFSYSGRLVKNDGSPVVGNANLTFELAYTNELNNVLCTKDLDNVSLSQGVFHVKLDFSCPLNSILANIPTGQSIAIRVIDRTSAVKAYSFQAIHSLPFSYMSQLSRQLAQMGASEGQILTWDASTSNWVPRNPVGTGNGSITEIIAGTGLSGGTITTSGTIAIADSGVNTLQLADSAVNSAKILDSTIVNSDISPTAAVDQSKIKDLVSDLGSKENTITSGSTAQYWRGDKSWQNLDASVRSALLFGYSIIPSMTGVSDGDTIQQAIGKLEGQIIANDAAFDSTGQWTKNGVMISYSAGNVGVGVLAPAVPLEIKGEMRLRGTNTGHVGLAPAPDAGNTTYILPTTDGAAGETLTTNGSGVLSWSAPTAVTTPDGNDHEIQFNLGGNFASSTSLTWNASTSIFNIGEPSQAVQLTFRGSSANEIISYPSGEMRIINSGNLNLQAPSVGVGTNSPTEKLTVAGNVAIAGSLKLKDSGTNYVQLKAPATTAGVTYILPASLGTPGQALVVSDASGALSWETPSTDNASLASNSVTSDKIVDGTIVDADIGSISQSKITGLSTALSSKEDSLPLSVSSNYYRGDKTWQPLNTDAVPEGTKLYFTEPLVLGTDLAGFVSGAGLVSSTDNVLTAIQKLDGNIGAVSTNQSNYILRDGSSAITNDLTLSNKKIIDLADPTLAQDAATKAYVDLKAGEASQWRDDGSDIYFNTGRVGIGNNDPAMPLHITSTGWGTILAEKVSNDNSGAEIHFSKSRGTTGSLLPVDSGDRLMSLFGSGSYSATQFTNNVASIEMKAAENFSGTAQGTSIEFGTTGLGTTTRLPRMTIAPSGFVGINTTNPQSSLDVRGTLRLGGATSGYVGFAPAAVAGNTTYTLPSADGSDGHVLKTNGSGVLSWGTPTSVINNLNSTQISDGSIDNTEFGYLNGVSSNIQTQLNEKQNAIISGFSAASFLQVNNGDSVVDALGKIQGQVNVNQTAFNSTGQWGKNVNDIFFNTGNVGIGTNTPVSKLQVTGGDLTLDSNRGIASTTGAKFFSGPAGHTWHVQSGDPIASIFIGKDFSGTTKFMFDNVGNLSVEGLIASNTGGFRFPDGSIQTTASGSPAAFMKKTMTAYQTVDIGSIVNFNTVYSGNGGLTATGNGIDLKAGHTYRLEASLNTHLGDGNGYLGYTFYNGTTNFGHGAYTDEPDSNGTYGFHSGLLEFYTPSVDTTVYVRIFDDNLGNGQVTPNYNTYFVVTEMVAGGISGASDNLGSHQAAQNIQLGSHWLSGDGGNEGIKIDANGNVGIGTSTPTQKLVVAGDINSNQEYSTSFTFPNGWAVGDWREVVQVNPASASGSSQYEVHISSTRNSWVDASTYMVGGAHQGANVWREAAQTYETTYGGNTKCFTVDFNGAARTIRVRALKASASCGVEDINIPITFKVRSLGQNTSWVPIASSGSGGTVTGVQSQTASWNLYTGDPKLNAGNLAIHANAQGKIGIGTNTPVEKIHVAGSEKMIFGPNATWGAHLVVGGNGWTGPHATVAATDGNLHLEARSGGYTTYLNWYSATGGVRVGNGSGGGYGPIAASAFNISSDLRLKTNIKKLENTSDKISQIRGVTYKYKDKKFNQDQQIGVIAQEVEKVFPEAIQKDEKGMLSVNYPVLVAPLIEAFKELQAKVEKLFTQEERVNREIASLKQENAELKKENQEMKEAVCEINPKARICK